MEGNGQLVLFNYLVHVYGSRNYGVLFTMCTYMLSCYSIILRSECILTTEIHILEMQAFSGERSQVDCTIVNRLG